MFRFATCLTLSALACLAGCSPPEDGGHRPDSKPDPLAQAEGRKFLQPSEPAGGKGVSAVRKDAKDGDEVVVVGRVGGSAKPFTEGRASFLIVDPSLKPTEGCDCPWDFCEYPKEDLAAARVSVRFVDAQGKTLKYPARDMFGIKELSPVVVTGKVSRDDKGNVAVVASGLHVRREEK